MCNYGYSSVSIVTDRLFRKYVRLVFVNLLSIIMSHLQSRMCCVITWTLVVECFDSSLCCFVYSSGAAWASVVAHYSEAVFSVAMVLYLKLPEKTWPRMLSVCHFFVCMTTAPSKEQGVTFKSFLSIKVAS